MSARRSSRPVSHTARAQHARTRRARARVREPAERITDALDRLHERYNPTNRDGETLDVLAGVYDWLRALVRLAAREVDPDGDGWAEDQAYQAIMGIAGVARGLANDIRDEAKKL